MTLRQLEPFAYGYYHCESDVVERRIAEGIYGVCRDLPLTIPTHLRLACVDRRPEGAIENVGVVYHCGDGIVCNAERLDEEIAAHPEYADELRAYRDYFLPKATYTIFKKGWSELQRKLYENNTLWGGTWGGHSNPDYGLLLQLGTDGLREKIARYRPEHPESAAWYDALERVLEGIDLLGDRFGELARELCERDPENREIYAPIAKAFETIPRKPASDMMTACQLFYLVFTLDGKDSPGTFDQYMWPYYRDCDRAQGRLLLEGIWQGFYETRAWNLCIGGSDEHWNDLSNDLTWEILDIAGKFGYNTPNLTMRVHRNTPQRLWEKAAEVIGTGIGMPSLYNDECVCPALEDLGIPPEDSHLYAMNGCNQIDIQGKSHMGLEDGEVCLLKCLEYALFDGKCLVTGETLGLRTGDAAQFATFEDLMAAYRAQVENAVKITVDMANASQKVFAENAPNPLRSCLLHGCIEKGRDNKRGGPIYNHGQILTEGLSDTTDSLAALKHFVFDTHTYTMAEVLDALEKNYEGYEDMFRAFRDYSGKFGNDVDEVDDLGNEVLTHYFTEMSKYRTWRDPVNGIYGGGMSTFQRTGRYGGSCGASASGRRCGDGNIADSIGPVPGRDVNGPTAVIKSALKYNQRLAKSGFVLQMKFDKQLFNTPKGREGFLALAKTYFANGGQMMSLNVLDPAELLDARKHPENHKNLIVRVGGYSAKFVELSDALKDNIIARTFIKL